MMSGFKRTMPGKPYLFFKSINLRRFFVKINLDCFPGKYGKINLRYRKMNCFDRMVKTIRPNSPPIFVYNNTSAGVILKVYMAIGNVSANFQELKNIMVNSFTYLKHSQKAYSCQVGLATIV